MNTRQQELEAFMKEAKALFNALRKWEKSKNDKSDLAGGLNMSFSLFLKQKESLTKRFPDENFDSLFRVMTRQFNVASRIQQGKAMLATLKSNPETFVTDMAARNQLMADMKRLAKSHHEKTAKKMQRACDALEESAKTAEKILVRNIVKEHFDRPCIAIKALNAELGKEKKFDFDEAFLIKIDLAIASAQERIDACKLKYGKFGEKLGSELQNELKTLSELRNSALVTVIEKREEPRERKEEMGSSVIALHK